MPLSNRFLDFSHTMQAQGKLLVRSDSSLATLSSFRIGGQARQIVYPLQIKTLCLTARLLWEEKIPFLVVGNATNLLFADEGFFGVILCTAHLKKCFPTPNGFWAQCGVPLPALSVKMAKRALTGMEFAVGIPATVGGAVYQNAGAFSGSISQCLQKSVAYCPKTDRIFCLSGPQHDFSYRKSCYQTNGCILLLSSFVATFAKQEDIFATMQQYQEKRKKTQPHTYPCAGSTFLRPSTEESAGALLERVGMKGVQIGGAKISEQHAGFCVNAGGATAQDMCRLISLCKRRVQEKTGILLQSEIEYILPNGTKEKP